MKKDYKLYNMILPPFLILGLTIPYLITTVVGNFIIDSIVLLLAILIIFKRLDLKLYIRKIFLVYLCGFAADIVGLIYLGIMSGIGQYLCNYGKIQQGTFARGIVEGMWSIFAYSNETTPYTYAVLISGIFVAAAAIFILNYFVIFRRRQFTKKQRLIFALMLAILTAPYTFLLRSVVFTL